MALEWIVATPDLWIRGRHLLATVRFRSFICGPPDEKYTLSNPL
jgi:hypothetical protein